MLDRTLAAENEAVALRGALEIAMNDLKALTKAIRARGGPDLQNAGLAGEEAWKRVAAHIAALKSEWAE